MKTPLIIIAASLVSLPLAADITLPGRRAPKLPPPPPDWTEAEEPPAAQTPTPSAPSAPGAPTSAGAADSAVPSPATPAPPTAADAAQAVAGAASPKPAPNPQDEALAEGLDEMTDILRSVRDTASADAAALELEACARGLGLNRLSGASLPQAMQTLRGSGTATASFRNYMQEVFRVTAARFYGSELLRQVLGEMN